VKPLKHSRTSSLLFNKYNQVIRLWQLIKVTNHLEPEEEATLEGPQTSE
jgi:hypothetical protein